MNVDFDLINSYDLVGICQKLIRIPSVNGQYPEISMAEVIMNEAGMYGLDVELLALDPQRPNVLVHVGPPGETAMVLVGHLDTVPVNDERAWDYPPFDAEISEGRIYGRGAVDTKGGITAALGALRLLNDQYGDILKQRVTFVGVPDEESGATGRLGVKYLHQIGKLSGKAAIYVYPDVDRINIGHRGVWRFRLTARGKSMHTGSLEWQNAPRGYNAVTGLADILNRLEAIKFKSSEVNPYFSDLSTVITPTTFLGGVSHGIVPDYAEAVVDVRLVPAVPRAKVEEIVNQVIEAVCRDRQSLSVEQETLIDLPATIIPADTELVKHLSESAEEIFLTIPQKVVSGPANESYLLNEMGIPTCTFGPIGAGAHAANEYVEASSLAKVAAVYALTGLKMMGAIRNNNGGTRS